MARRERPRVLVVYSQFGLRGGATSVAAWTLEALKDQYDVSLLSWDEVDVDALHSLYGPPLRQGDFEVIRVPARYRLCLHLLPTAGAQLRLGLAMRACRALRKERDFEAVVGLENEADYGAPAIQYVHYPWFKLPRPEIELRWFHRLPGLAAAYRWATTTALGCSLEHLRANVTLANSEFVAQEIRSAHGIESRVLSPAVLCNFPAVEWEQRQNRVVGISRFHPAKRWEEAFHIVKSVRARGHDLRLCMIGFSDIAPYLQELRALERVNAEWFELKVDISRAELVRTVSESRYGIHCMVEEHFGIAVAELALAGCIPFVHDSGGPPAIVGGEPALRFSTREEAVNRMDAVLADEREQQAIRARLAAHVQRFNADEFIAGVRDVVARFLNR